MNQKDISISRRKAIAGGVHFSGEWSVCYKANLESRLATRILWQIARAPYVDEEEVYELATRQRWADLFEVSRTFRVATTAIKRRTS